MFAERKAVDAVRVQLSSQLGLANLYDLDRLDLTVRTTLDGLVNDAVTRELQRVSDCGEAARAGLVAPRLLNGRACGPVVYSFTLYERVPGGNAAARASRQLRPPSECRSWGPRRSCGRS
jgi:membrane peptidoglycan carboxypeptidase